ncbi:hypothetical protein, partial [Bradyrhizobium jicamae]|uniref:hypothetical protein n=1 Tax=Bradyrhizobium jicamae TaxID=280332 RepID=UPI001AECAF34
PLSDLQLTRSMERNGALSGSAQRCRLCKNATEASSSDTTETPLPEMALRIEFLIARIVERA